MKVGAIIKGVLGTRSFITKSGETMDVSKVIVSWKEFDNYGNQYENSVIAECYGTLDPLKVNNVKNSAQIIDAYLTFGVETYEERQFNRIRVHFPKGMYVRKEVA